MLSSIGFLNPLLLFGLLALPAIWWLLRATPPAPNRVAFPATRLLKDLQSKDTETSRTPWWLTLLRMMAAALVIFALANPVINPEQNTLRGSGPVVVMLDNGWAAAKDWERRVDTVRGIITRAETANRPIALLTTTSAAGPAEISLSSAAKVRDQLEAIEPRPFAPDRLAAMTRLEKAGIAMDEATFVWIADHLDYGAASELAEKLRKLSPAQLNVMTPSVDSHPIIVNAIDGPSNDLTARVRKLDGKSRTVTVTARNLENQTLTQATVALPAGKADAELTFKMPLELRNQVAQFVIQGEDTAGATHLLDATSRHSRIGLFAGGGQEQAQPLLAPLYYVDRALKPFSELVSTKDNATAAAVRSLLDRKVTSIILADIGNITGDAAQQLSNFVSAGGVLVRFAGPRLEKSADELLPAPLRFGGRTLGGALSWSTPQALATFDDNSVFNGLAIPADVRIERQVLVDAARLSTETEIWARLTDDTPLVTAKKRGSGWIVLFHVTANSDWSNLPLSGLFVDMLRRVSALSTYQPPELGEDRSETALIRDAETEAEPETTGSADETGRTMAPVLTTNGFGVLGAPPTGIKSIAFADMAKRQPSAEFPPGLYGPSDNPRAFNLIRKDTTIAALKEFPASATMIPLSQQSETVLKPWLLFLALILLFADMIATMFLRGFKLRTPAAKSAPASLVAIAMAAAVALAWPAATQAQTSAPQTKPAPTKAERLRQLQSQVQLASRTRLAFVRTGDSTLDSISEAGLRSLTMALIRRTAVEPAEPIGVNIETDDLTFYPILYWPVPANVESLPAATLERVDGYMKRGGMIIFDTRDAGTTIEGVPSARGTSALQKLLGKLDIPRLEPVPKRHVLTRSFYLLSSFPGRFDSSKLWVEARSSVEGGSVGKARRADGVSSILITGNDFARAWALDQNQRPLYPVVPGGPVQRELAFRVGVNIVMYALTGNYKADQVHVPALLERLGQ